MAHASGVQWFTHSKSENAAVSVRSSSDHQLRKCDWRRKFNAPSTNKHSGIRFLFVLGIVFFSVTFGTFIHTSFGLEEESHTGTIVRSVIPSPSAEVETVHGSVQHVVTDGDTLWALAQAHAPKGMDLRQYVHEIRVLNQMNQSVIYEGQVIWLP